MSTRILNENYAIKMLKSLIACIFLSLFIINLNAYGAGTSSTPSKSASELRKEANVYFDQGKQFQEMGKYKEAAVKYERAIKIDRKYAEAWSNLGYTLRKRDKFDRAVKAYKKAIKLDPNLAEAH